MRITLSLFPLQMGRWTIFNDEKVAVSEKPPKELGYMFLYKRVE